MFGTQSPIRILHEIYEAPFHCLFLIYGRAEDELCILIFNYLFSTFLLLSNSMVLIHMETAINRISVRHQRLIYSAY